MDTEKMRRTLERNEDAYQWRYLATREQPPVPPALRRLAVTMAAFRNQTVRVPSLAHPQVRS